MALSRDHEPGPGTWVRAVKPMSGDKTRMSTYRPGNGGWGQPGTAPLAKWVRLWDYWGELELCGPWGADLPGKKILVPTDVLAVACKTCTAEVGFPCRFFPFDDPARAYAPTELNNFHIVRVNDAERAPVLGWVKIYSLAEAEKGEYVRLYWPGTGGVARRAVEGVLTQVNQHGYFMVQGHGFWVPALPEGAEVYVEREIDA